MKREGSVMEKAGKHILVVDDDPVLRTLFQVFLEHYGYTSETAANGEEAETKLAQAAYDAVLLDYMMPGITGLTVLQHIKQRDPSLPVAVITENVGGQVAAMALLAGAQACLYKPFTSMEFNEVLECLVGTPPVEAVVSNHPV